MRRGKSACPDTFHRGEFGLVVVGCSGAVGVDVTDVGGGEAGHAHSLAHGAVGTLAVFRRRCLVERVAGIGITAQLCEGSHTSPPHALFAFKHYIGSALAEIYSGAVAVERAATVAVKNHESVEAVQVETCECFRTTGYHDVGHSGLYEG